MDVGCNQRAGLFFSRAGDFGDPPYSDEHLDQMAFDPGQVTDLVGLQPTSSWRRGDPHRQRPGGQRFSGWTYDLPSSDTYITEDVVVALLDAVEPFADRIRNACRTLGLEVGIMVVITTRGDTGLALPAIDYRADTLHRLARLDLSLEHDQYVQISTA